MRGRTIGGAAVIAIALVSGCGISAKRSTGNYIDDMVMTDRVEAALGASRGYRFPGVHVEASGGKVMLTGSVETPEERAEAEGIARSVGGVGEIENRIAVRQGSGAENSIRQLPGNVSHETR